MAEVGAMGDRIGCVTPPLTHHFTEFVKRDRSRNCIGWAVPRDLYCRVRNGTAAWNVITLRISLAGQYH
ncbi:MAG: hypothetical protein HC781_16880 [Leptolyngbyaceae cyanobacterium CSU_1_4]|nr:hypothetical protein [Leptolyngbyaceae cyanobacterium CSU_1_4]